MQATMQYVDEIDAKTEVSADRSMGATMPYVDEFDAETDVCADRRPALCLVSGSRFATTLAWQWWSGSCKLMNSRKQLLTLLDCGTTVTKKALGGGG